MGNLLSSTSSNDQFRYYDDNNRNRAPSQAHSTASFDDGVGIVSTPSNSHQQQEDGMSSFALMMANQQNVHERLRSNSEASLDGERSKYVARSRIQSIGESSESSLGGKTTSKPLTSYGVVNNNNTTTMQTPLHLDLNHRDWWMPDSACKECYKCQERFHFFFRRHHCRLCGLVFCYKCSSNFVYSHEFGFKQRELIRVCDDCHTVLPSLMNNARSPSSPRSYNHRHDQSSSNRSVRVPGSSNGRFRRNDVINVSSHKKGSMKKVSGSSNSNSNSNSNRNIKSNSSSSHGGSGGGRAHKISRTGTEGINARFDGQTYDGVDLEFDDIHSEDEFKEVEDSPSHGTRKRIRRKSKSKSKSKNGRSVGKRSGFGDGFFPTNPSSSDDNEEKEEEEEDFFVTSKVLDELTKSPRTSAMTGNRIKKKKSTSTFKKRGGGSDIKASRDDNHGRVNGNVQRRRHGRSISMNQNGYRERVLSTMSSNQTLSQISNQWFRNRGESVGDGSCIGENDNETPGQFTLFAALKRANEEAESANFRTKKTVEESKNHITRSMNEDLLQKYSKFLPTRPLAVAASSSSSSSSLSTSKNKTMSPVIEGEISSTSHSSPSSSLISPMNSFTTTSLDTSHSSNSVKGKRNRVEDNTLNELQLQILQSSTFDFLKSDLQVSLIPVLDQLKMYYKQHHQENEEFKKNQQTAQTDISSYPPTLDEHILVRKALALVRQAMQVSSYPTGNSEDDSGPSTIDGRHPDFCYDISQFVRVKPVPGGDVLKDSKFVHGVVFNKNIAHRSMKKTLKRPRIVLVSDGIEWKHRLGGGVVSMETLQDQERKYIEIMVAKIATLRPNLFITSGAVSSIAVDLFKSTRLTAPDKQTCYFPNGCTVLRNVNPSVLKSIARFTNATILSNAHVASHFNSEDVVGTCGIFDVKKHAGSPFVYLEEDNIDNDIIGSRGHDIGGNQELSRTLEGSVGTVLIHSGSDHVSQTISMIMRRLVRSSIASAYSLSLESHYLNDIFGVLPSSSNNNQQHQHHHQHHNNRSVSNSRSGIQRIQTVPVKRSNGSNCSGAPLWATRSRVVSAENNVQLKIEDLRNNVGRGAKVSGPSDHSIYSSHSRVNSGMKPRLTEADELRARFDDMKKDQAKQTTVSSATPPLVLHDAFGRSKEVSFACCWRHPEENRQCCPPTEVNIRFYSMDDRPLGLWMRQQCFNYDFPCLSSKCKRRSIEHRLAYTRPEGQLNIRTEIMELSDVEHIRSIRARQLGRVLASPGVVIGMSEEEEEEEEEVLDPGEIYTWGFCKICCDIVTPVVPLTRQTLAMSFGRFLEAWFFNDQVLCRDEECNHRLHRDHVRFYGRFDSHGQAGLQARFEFHEITTFTVAIPGIRNDDDDDDNYNNKDKVSTTTSFSSSLRPRLEPPDSPDTTNEIRFLRDATSVLFQAFQERMRGFLMERLIRGCLQRLTTTYGMSKERRMAGQELYTHLRASWWSSWNAMMEEQEAFSSLLGIPTIRGSGSGSTTIVGSPETIKVVQYNASLWTDKGVKEIELYALRRRLVQMVNQWNINMIAMYTNIINSAYNGEWVVTGDDLIHEVNNGFGGGGGSISSSSSSSSSATVSTVNISNESDHKDASVNNMINEVEAATEKELSEISDLEELYGRNGASSTTKNSENRSRIRLNSQVKCEPIPIPERIARGGTPTQPVTPLVTRSVKPSPSLNENSPAPPQLPLNVATIVGTSGLTDTPRDKISPVVRSNTLSSSNTRMSTITRSCTIETSGGSELASFQNERMRLLNSGPLAHYAYSSLFDSLGVDHGLEGGVSSNSNSSDIPLVAEVIPVDVSLESKIAAPFAPKAFTSTDTSTSNASTMSNIEQQNFQPLSQHGGGESIDPRAYALSVPMDMFPELCERHLLLSTGYRGVVIPINWPNNPCSVIAKSLSTTTYIDELRDAIELTRSAHDAQQRGHFSQKNENIHPQTNSADHHSRSDSSTSDRGGLLGLFGAEEADMSHPIYNGGKERSIKPLHLSDLLVTSTANRHLKINFSDDDLTFTCTVPCAPNFYALRRTYCKRFERSSIPGKNGSNHDDGHNGQGSTNDELFGSYTPVLEEDYIQSLCKSKIWDTNGGGKSGATFTKSEDNRFIMKRIRKTEYDMFVSSSLKYFSYMREALYEDMPTMLVKILGIHAIKVQRNRNSRRPLGGVDTKHHHHTKSVLSFDLNADQNGSYSSASSSGNFTTGGNNLSSGASIMSNSSDDAAIEQTIYVIVQENLFHMGSTTNGNKMKPPTTIFDLKGVLRFRRNSVVGSGVRGGMSSSSSSSSQRTNSLDRSSNTSLHGSSEPNTAAFSAGQKQRYGINQPGAEEGTKAISTAAAAAVNSNENFVEQKESHSNIPSVIRSTTSSTTTTTNTRSSSSSSSSILVDGDFLQCTSGLPIPLYYRDRALLDCAIQNDTLFLSTMNVVDYSLLVGVRNDDIRLSCGIIDYLHPYNFIKRAENLFKDGLHEMKLRSAESTIQKASEYKRRFRAATELYFMALPNDM